MKKLAVVLMTVLFSFVGIFSQVQANENENVKLLKNEFHNGPNSLKNSNGNTVSDFAKQSFYKDFGDIPNVNWRKVKNFNIVSFTQNNQKKEAFYDIDANLVGTTTEKAFADLPENAQKTINTKYNGYKIGPVIFFDDNEYSDTDMILYGTQFDDADNYFVELKNGNDKLVVRVDTAGFVDFFKKL